MTDNLKTLFKYTIIGLTLSLPLIIGFTLALTTGETVAFIDSGAAHSKPMYSLSGYILGSIIIEPFWLMLTLYCLVPGDKQL